jgi:glutaconyl-CoA decarboxylase
MPGKVLSINVEVGDKVKAGQPVLILEAMKMENILNAPSDGTVKEIKVAPGANANQGDLLIVIE